MTKFQCPKSEQRSAPLLVIGHWCSVILLACCAAPNALHADEPVREVRIKHVAQDVEGWTILVDEALLDDGEHAETGKLSLKVLAAKLFEVSLVVPDDRLKKLRKVPIYLDAMHPLTNMQYHPGAGWLRDHGFDPKMVKAVHIPRARRLINHQQPTGQPWAVLHELAHAYHDRELGFENRPIRNAYDKAVAAGNYEKVLHIRGHETRHYALTNHKEYFAELSESYFGTNDFHPFVRGALKQHDPEGFAVMKAIWGDRK